MANIDRDSALQVLREIEVYAEATTIHPAMLDDLGGVLAEVIANQSALATVLKDLLTSE